MDCSRTQISRSVRGVMSSAQPENDTVRIVARHGTPDGVHAPFVLLASINIAPPNGVRVAKLLVDALVS
jgi:hypothetical protein